MTHETTDESTERQYREGVSPNTTVRDDPERRHPVAKATHRRPPDNYRVLDHAIKFETPEGVQTVNAPRDWGLYYFHAVRQIADLLGYAQTAPDADSMFVFTPKVHADETTPFDRDDRTLPSRLTLIPATRTYEVHETPTGYTARMYDYASGREYSVRVDAEQPDLRAVDDE